MKQSQLYILIANIHIVASFLVHGLGALMLLFLGFLWLIGAIGCFSFERTIERLERLKARLQFEMILDLLSDHPNRRSKK